MTIRMSIQEELFSIENFTRSCSSCGGEFPRSIEFFPKGRCKDKMASFCRKCSSMFDKSEIIENKIDSNLSKLFLGKKICSVCKYTKELREFYMTSKSQDGKTSSCKKCIDAKYDERKIHQGSFNEFIWTVYFVQDTRNKRVKIGSSEDPLQTLNDLQEGSSEKLNLLAYYDSGEKTSSEISVNALKCLFESHHTGNGWYEMVPPLEQFIALIKRGDVEAAKILLNIQDFENNGAL